MNKKIRKTIGIAMMAVGYLGAIICLGDYPLKTRLG
jgi:hypothetical protein